MRRFLLLCLLLALAGCNLATTDQAATVVPLPTTSYVAPTPYRAPLVTTPGALAAPTLIGAQAQAANNQPNASSLLTPVPAQTLLQHPQPSATSQNAIEAFVDNLIIPVWNLIYTFIIQSLSTMWLFAGARGGVFAQVFCCIIPVLAVIAVLLIRFRVVRFRR